MLSGLKHLVTEPLPDLAFEVSENGIAWARPRAAAPPAVESLEPGVLGVSPLRDNVLKPPAFNAAVAKIAGATGARKRRKAVLILPDFCARTAVLDFDSFPSNAEEQMSLLRFRMKKSVPFDLEDAVIRYHPQSEAGSGRLNVVVVVASLEILAHYEAPFRAAGLHVGHVTMSSLAALELQNEPGISLLVRRSGRVLSMLVLRNGVLKLLRTVELHEGHTEEILSLLFPTLAFIEDELRARPDRLLCCGVDPETASRLESELGIPAKALESRWGAPGEATAGLLGYLESIR